MECTKEKQIPWQFSVFIMSTGTTYIYILQQCTDITIVCCLTLFCFENFQEKIFVINFLWIQPPMKIF